MIVTNSVEPREEIKCKTFRIVHVRIRAQSSITVQCGVEDRLTLTNPILAGCLLILRQIHLRASKHNITHINMIP